MPNFPLYGRRQDLPKFTNRIVMANRHGQNTSLWSTIRKHTEVVYLLYGRAIHFPRNSGTYYMEEVNFFCGNVAHFQSNNRIFSMERLHIVYGKSCAHSFLWKRYASSAEQL